MAMISEVSALTGVPVDELLGRGRAFRAVTARQLYWKLLREKKHYSYSALGDLNDRTHSTIVQGVKRANDLLDSGDKLAVEMWNIIKNIKS